MLSDERRVRQASSDDGEHRSCPSKELHGGRVEMSAVVSLGGERLRGGGATPRPHDFYIHRRM